MSRAACPVCGAAVRVSPLVGLVCDHGRCPFADAANAMLLLDLDATRFGGPTVTRSPGRGERVELAAAGATDAELARAVVEVERVTPSLVRRRVVGIDVAALLAGTPTPITP